MFKNLSIITSLKIHLSCLSKHSTNILPLLVDCKRNTGKIEWKNYYHHDYAGHENLIIKSHWNPFMLDSYLTKVHQCHIITAGVILRKWGISVKAKLEHLQLNIHNQILISHFQSTGDMHTSLDAQNGRLSSGLNLANQTWACHTMRANFLSRGLTGQIMLM